MYSLVVYACLKLTFRNAQPRAPHHATGADRSEVQTFLYSGYKSAETWWKFVKVPSADIGMLHTVIVP